MLPSSGPRHWQRSSSHENFRFLETSGLRVKYVGPGDSDSHAASIRTTDPALEPLFYFEIEILNRGRDGFIGIGFVNQDFNAGRLPGWEPNTYGYHGDDGKAFHNSSIGWKYGPTFGTGDRIGVILNRAERTITYQKNGISLGIAFDNVHEEVLYPAVGLRTPDEEVLANMGQLPYRSNLALLRVEAARQVECRIQQTALPTDRVGSTMGMYGKLIFNHLVLNGHWSSAAVVARDLLSGSVSVAPSEVEDFGSRRRVRDSILAGDIDAALAHAEGYHAGSLAASPSVLFRLQCQKLIELVRVKDDQGALAHGKAALGSPPGAEQQTLLSDALTLLCYNDPVGSPQGALLEPATRAALADDVDAALLKARSRPQQSALERLYASLAVLRRELESSRHPGALLIDFDRLLGLSPPEQ